MKELSIETWEYVIDKNLCPECFSEREEEIEMEPHTGANEYMGDYGSAKAYQYIVYSYKCPKCGNIEEC
jgi:uncharacterized OB-fold protein